MSARAITVDPGIHFGQPCIAGTRIPVHAVLELVRAGVAFDDMATVCRACGSGVDRARWPRKRP
jgi:uncharacterized protein (DUF433 family)